MEYTPTQLDFLALLFTVVKLLYIGGALPRCARVVHLLDSAARASAQELHKTLIRNEAAYFGCVKQLVLQHPPPPQPQAAGTLPLYLCGDSHCLSGLPLQPCDACHALPCSFVFSHKLCLFDLLAWSCCACWARNSGIGLCSLPQDTHVADNRIHMLLMSSHTAGLTIHQASSKLTSCSVSADVTQSLLY